MRRSLLSSLILALLLAPPVAAQLIPASLKDCKNPKEPLGAMTAHAIIAFLLPSGERLDTASILMLRVDGVTVTGARSVITRQFAACKFDGPRAAKADTTWVAQEITIDSTAIAVSPIRTLPQMPTAVPATPVAAIDSTIAYPVSGLDERPRNDGCKEARGLYSGAGNSPTTPDLSTQVGSWIRVQFTISASGRVDPATAEFQQVNNPAVKSRVLKYLEGCRYIPGRIAGIRVGTIMDYEGWFK